VDLDDYPEPFFANDVMENTVGIAKVNSLDTGEVSMITKSNSGRSISLLGMRKSFIRNIETYNVIGKGLAHGATCRLNPSFHKENPNLQSD
jgi:hypothetical protein